MNQNSKTAPVRNATHDEALLADEAKYAPGGRVPAHLQVDDYEPAGFTRITRARPSKRAQSAERERFDTRRQPREGKY
jgi:hypothetical protein